MISSTLISASTKVGHIKKQEIAICQGNKNIPFNTMQLQDSQAGTGELLDKISTNNLSNNKAKEFIPLDQSGSKRSKDIRTTRIREEYIKIQPRPLLNSFFIEDIKLSIAYVNTSSKGTKRANCTGINLTGENLTNSNFTKSIFEEAIFTESKLKNVCFERTRLNSATITKADGLTVPQLVKAKFQLLKAEDKLTKQLIQQALELKPAYEVYYLLNKCKNFDDMTSHPERRKKYREKIQYYLSKNNLIEKLESMNKSSINKS